MQRTQVGAERLRQRPAGLLLKILGHRRETPAEEAVEDLGQSDRDAVPDEHLDQALAAQHFAVDQDAVAVEYDQVAIDHRRNARSIRFQWAKTAAAAREHRLRARANDRTPGELIRGFQSRRWVLKDREA